jgi:hypothetical protein
MKHAVFLSHSSNEQEQTDTLCARLEAASIKCWKAPRDILPGRVWSEAIVEAIESSQAVVVIFTDAANRSPQVLREVEIAAGQGLPMIPVRLEEIRPCNAMRYFLCVPHWLDAYKPPLETHYDTLVSVVREILSKSSLKKISREVGPEAKQRSGDLRSGDLLFDRYILDKIAGRGGTGTTWKAYDRQLHCSVALRILASSLAADPDYVRHVEEMSETRMQAAHRYIQPIFDFKRQGDLAVVSAQWINGKTLAEIQNSRNEHFFEPSDIIQWICHIGEALEYAHGSLGLTHGDLQPSKVFVRDNGRVAVSDFGTTGPLPSGYSGTPLYLSPQLLGGEKAVPSDDIYAFGLLIYVLLTGRPPFVNVNQIGKWRVETVADQRAAMGIDGDPIPAEWETMLLACLEGDAQNRTQTVREVIDRLANSIVRP